MLNNKYALTVDSTILFEEIVRASYEADKIDMCLKLGFIPVVVDDIIAEDVYIRVPVSRIQFKIELSVIKKLEKIGNESMTSIQAELWRIKRSLDILKNGKLINECVNEEVNKEDNVQVNDVNDEIEKKEIRTINRIKIIDKKVKKIKEYVNGAIICDDGKEKWINAEWTQTCEFEFI